MSQENEAFLIVCSQRTSGGAERVATLLANQLAEDGYTVYFLQFFSNEQDYILSKKVKLLMIDIQDRNPIIRKVKRLGQCVKTIRRIKADYVIPFLGITQDICYIATRFQKKSSLISTIRINPAVSPRNRILRWKRNIMCFLSDAVFVQNSEQKMYFPKCMHRKIFGLANPVDEKILDKSFIPENGIKRIVAAGRLTEQKNHELLIRAFARISSQYSQIDLVIYGEGPLREKLTDLIYDLGLSERIELFGRVSVIQDHYRPGDLFVLSSDYEGMPNALMEAMAMGLPVVSTECPTGPKDLINDVRDGLLVPCNDVQRMVEAIKKIIDNPDLAVELGRAAKKKMEEHYSIKIISKKFVEYCKTYGRQ